jgi:hypothetical protein
MEFFGEEARSMLPHHIGLTAQAGAARAIIETTQQRLSKNVHSAGAGAAWPETSCDKQAASPTPSMCRIILGVA